MSGQLKTLKRTVVLMGYVNRYSRVALREIFEAYRDMLVEMVSYTLEHRSFRSTLHRIFYHKYREKYPGSL